MFLAGAIAWLPLIAATAVAAEPITTVTMSKVRSICLFPYYQRFDFSWKSQNRLWFLFSINSFG
jgi:hypothetical protein